MKIYIVRHAQSKRNARIESEVDADLTDIGEEQARRLGKYFHGVKLDKVYCSTLNRAKSTLEKIKPFVKGVPIVYSENMIEMRMGKYAQGGIDDWQGFFKEAGEKMSERYHLFRPDGGESLQDCYNRARKFYLHLLKNHLPKDRILLVGHGFFSMYLILSALGLDLFEARYYNLSNASISTLDLDKSGKVKDFHVNDYHHLIHEGMKSLNKKD